MVLAHDLSPMPMTFLIISTISSCSMAPELSMSSTLKHASKSSSRTSSFFFSSWFTISDSCISSMVFRKNYIVSSRSRVPFLSVSKSVHKPLTMASITASIFTMKTTSSFSFLFDFAFYIIFKKLFNYAKF